MNTDVVILGAGPVGLFAGFYAGMRNMSTIIVDQLEVPGGQLSALYPEKNIYDVAGFPEVKAKDLIQGLTDQLSRFEDSSKLLMNNKIETITKEEDGSFTVITDKEEIKAKAIIIAGGNGAFSARPLGIENEEEVTNIDYFIKDPSIYSDKDVTIFGGGDSAVDFALMLEEVAKSVTIVHRREQFRAHETSVDQLKASSVDIIAPGTLVDMDRDGTVITKLVLEDKEGNKKEVAVDNIVCNYGFVSDLGSIKEFGLELDKNKIVVDSMQHTSVEGIMAIGDVCTYPGKANLIICGFGEGPIAINEAFKYINPDVALKAIHSTNIVK